MRTTCDSPETKRACDQTAAYCCATAVSVLELGRPFNTPSKLDGGDHLTLLHIVRSQIPASKFAFLSVGHITQMTDRSISDDARYLNTAMQHCRFRSVTGTMDGDLTECFCSPVFLLNGQGIASYTRNRQRRFATKKRASRELCKLQSAFVDRFLATFIQRIYFESTGRAPEGHREPGK
ncbi:hypothetical protein EDB87DRAFT_1632713 [Lactarius vividus]|nr:hypothetical protein EDB87DRAFT_1632713 [Lactarius vividus]